MWLGFTSQAQDQLAFLRREIVALLPVASTVFGAGHRVRRDSLTRFRAILKRNRGTRLRYRILRRYDGLPCEPLPPRGETIGGMRWIGAHSKRSACRNPRSR